MTIDNLTVLHKYVSEYFEGARYDLQPGVDYPLMSLIELVTDIRLYVDNCADIRYTDADLISTLNNWFVTDVAALTK